MNRDMSRELFKGIPNEDLPPRMFFIGTTSKLNKIGSYLINYETNLITQEMINASKNYRLECIKSMPDDKLLKSYLPMRNLLEILKVWKTDIRKELDYRESNK